MTQLSNNYNTHHIIEKDISNINSNETDKNDNQIEILNISNT